MWCKYASACPKIGTWKKCTELLGRYPLGDKDGGLGTVEAGLPNITGYVGYGVGDGTYSVYTNGAFYNAGTVNAITLTGAYTQQNLWGAIRFSANKSNNIYGKSSTVTPPSAKLIPYIRTE